MVDKEKMHSSQDVISDMQESLPGDRKGNGKDIMPERPPITLVSEEPLIADPTEMLKLMLGDGPSSKIVDEIISKPTTNFSNMSIEAKDIDYVKKYFNNYRILLSHDIPQPVAVVKLGGRTIATVADMTTITGKAKARKSYFLSAVITAALNPTYYKETTLKVTLPEDRDKIIWIDTEQSDYWSQQILHRVRRSGVDEKQIDDRIIYLNCRDLSITQLKAMGYIALDKYSSKSAFCIIDGSRDLVTSVNNEEESTQLARWLPEIAKKYVVNVTNVLHQNPSGGTGSKLRGHLGTELMNKSEFVVEIEQHPKDKEVYVASSMLSRDIGTDDLCFEIIDGLLQFVDEPVDMKSEKSKFMYDFTISELKKLIKIIFITKSSYNQKNLSIAIQSHIKDNHAEHIGVQKIVAEWIPYLENKGLIALDDNSVGKNGMGKFYKKQDFANTPTNEENKEVEAIEVIDSDDLPF